MKKHLTGLGICLLLIAAVTLTAFDQQQKDKTKKEQQQEKDKKQNKADKAQKENDGKNDKGQPGNKEEKINKGKSDEKGNKGRDNENKNNGKDDGLTRNDNGNDDYNWNRENFKDRDKIKKGEKVTICHKFNNENEPAVTIRVSANAQKAHLAHGDFLGDCPTVQDNRFSDIFLSTRNSYYNNLYETKEQVVYSQSILEYAITRLTDSRLQLATMRNNNLPPAEIERKQAVVVELEQNVTLLEALVGAAANLLVNKLL